jgi:hypothetical protein
MDQYHLDKLIASTNGRTRDEWVNLSLEALGLDISEEYVKHTLRQLDNKDVETQNPID